ncbi:MAG: LamG-like jellyroll fold domain-containing protein [Pirellulaceae bacterium]
MTTRMCWTLLTMAVLVGLCHPAHAAAASPLPVLADKTLVAWATVPDRAQRGGSLLTVQEDEWFDAIVFGERAAERWMAGSDFFRRTQAEEGQVRCASETAAPPEPVQLAVVYAGKQVTLYRNGQVYSSYEVGAPQRFEDYSLMLGLRYLGASGAIGFYQGNIEEARLYDVALTPEQIGALRIDQPADSAPIGWWTFDDGTANDLTGHFPAGVLAGGARIVAGQLQLNGTDAFLLIDRFRAEPQHMFYHPRSRATGRMWDTWLYFQQGTYYLYYLANCGPSWDNISLATSSDGVHWTEHGVVLSKRPDAVWMGTGSTWKSPEFDKQARFFLNFSEWRGNQQTIFFAESPDLIHWQRLDDRYEFKPAPQWYNVDEGNNSRWDCIYTIPRETGGLYGYWTATPQAATEGRFGFGETTDGVTWRALPPPRVRDVEVGEVGALERIGNRYYMMFGTGGIMVTLVADHPEGPFGLAAKNRRLLAGHTYFARFFPSPDGLLVNHHSIARNGAVYGAPLKATRVDDEGTLRLAWWTGNEKLKHEPVTGLTRPTHVQSDGRPGLLDAKVDPARGVVLEGTLTLPAGPAAKPTGLYVECGPDQGVAILVSATGATEIGPLRADGTGFACEKQIDRQWSFGSQSRFRLLLKQSLLEFYLDDLLIECFSLSEPATGRIGVIESEVECVTDLVAWY